MAVLKFCVVMTTNMEVTVPWHVTLLARDASYIVQECCGASGRSNRRYGVEYNKTVRFTMAKFVFVLLMMIIIVVNITKLMFIGPCIILIVE